MFGLQMLDVLIGIVFVYLLMSLVCSAVGEMIETVLKCRACCLKRSLQKLFNDKQGTGPTKELYEHPLIYGLFKGEYNPKKTRNLPSYISARDFALALMDIVISPQTQSDTPQAEQPCMLKLLQQAIRTDSSKDSPEVKKALSGLSNIKKALTPLVDTAEDLNNALKNIELWYDGVMERVTGWYKRRMQLILLIVALIVTIAVNVDTLTITKYLSRDAAARNAIVEIAQNTVKEQSAASQGTALQDSNDTEKLVNALSSVQELGLPIGWSDTPFKWTPLRFSNYWEQSSPHLAGWIITAIALSMGASFWFDFLKRLIAIRSSIKPEEKSSKKDST